MRDSEVMLLDAMLTKRIVRPSGKGESAATLGAILWVGTCAQLLENGADTVETTAGR